MTETVKRRRRWPWIAAAAAILLLLVLVVCFPPMTGTERQMLGTWRQAGSRVELTFERGHRMVRRLREGLTSFGRWAATDGRITEYEFDSLTITTAEAVRRRVDGFLGRRSPNRTCFLVEVDGDRMLWRIGKDDPETQVFTRVR